MKKQPSVRPFLYLLSVLGFVTLAFLFFAREHSLRAQERGGDTKTITLGEVSVEAPTTPAATSAAGSRRILGDRDARRHGITLASVRAALKDLKASGAIDGSESNAELSILVTEHIAAKPENRASFSGTGPSAPNWDAIFAFVEKLIALIMKFFPVVDLVPMHGWDAVGTTIINFITTEPVSFKPFV